MSQTNQPPTPSSASISQPDTRPLDSRPPDAHTLEALAGQTQALMSAMSDRLAHLTAGEQSLRARVTQLDTRERELVERLTILQDEHTQRGTALVAQHAQAQAQTAARDQQLRAFADQLEQRRGELESRRAELDQFAAQATAAVATAQAQAAQQVEQAQAQAQAQAQQQVESQVRSRLEPEVQARLTAARHELAAQAKLELDAAQARITELTAVSDAQSQRERALAEHEQQLEGELTELERRRAFIAQSEASAAREQAEARHTREQAEQLRFSSEKESRRLRSQLEQLAAQLSSAQAAAIGPDAAKLTEQFDQRLAQQRFQLEGRFADEAQTLKAAIDARERSLQDAEARLDQAQARAGTAEVTLAQLQKSTTTADQRLATAQQRIDSLSKRLFDAQSELATIHQQQAAAPTSTASTSVSLTSASKAQTAHALAEAEAFNTQREQVISGLQSRVRSLEQMLERNAQASEQASVQPTANFEVTRLSEQLQQREDALVALADRLSRAEMHARDADARLASAKSAAVQPTPSLRGHTSTLDPELRRKRLALCRTLMIERRKQLAAQARSLKSKEFMTERVIEQRVQSAMAAQAMIVRAPEHHAAALTSPALLATTKPGGIPGAAVAASGRPARNPAMIAAAALAAGGGVAYVGYLGVDLVAPSTYAARTMISADTGGVTPVASELEVWKFRHINMLTDDLVFGLAAESFARQGIPDLGRMDRVRSFIGGNLTYNADRAGELTLQLRAESKQTAELVLRTFGEALRAQANTRRFSNAVTYTTAIATPAEALADPIAGPGGFRGAFAVISGLVSAVTLGVLAMTWRPRKSTKAAATSSPALAAGPFQTKRAA